MSRIKPLLVVTFICSSSLLFAQSSGSQVVTYGLVALVILLVLGAVFSVSDNLFRLQAQRLGVQDDIEDEPNFFSLKRSSSGGGEVIKQFGAKTSPRGFDLNLKGKPSSTDIHDKQVNTFALQPKNFRGIAPIPKLMIEVGEEVKAGDPIFFDKTNPTVKYVAPVSGELTEVRRGEKRSISELVFLADKEITFKSFDLPSIDDNESLVAFLKESGFWPHIKQRPFNLVADADVVPRDIFISAYNTGPLAPDPTVILDGQEDSFQKGLDVLSRLTSGKVHLGLEAKADNPFNSFDSVEKHYFKGKHPMGNVGVQIHHIKPILNGDDIVWTLDIQDVILLGNLFLHAKYDSTRIIALAGDELKEAKYIRTRIGANIGDLMADELANDHVRVISGDVLTGQKKESSNFLNITDSLISVVSEGDYYEMFGWLVPQSPRPSLSRTYPGFLLPSLQYKADTNTHGEQRAFVVTGQYEDVLPMDLYPQHLFKAILTNDYERIEGLGIFELEKEDVALCEFVCTSKQPLQEILEKGQEMIIAEG